MERKTGFLSKERNRDPLQTKGEMSSNTTAFRNPDGTVTAVVLNPFDIEKTVTLGGKNCVLPPRSFNTFVI